MPSFSYIAVNQAGKRVKDSVEASSLETAKNSLRNAGYTILEIKELGALNQDIELPFLGNPTAKDMAIFCRQFQSILKAGVPVSTVLSMLGQQTDNDKLAAAIRERFLGVEPVINFVGPVIGSHSGPGTVALFFLAKRR